MIGALRGFIGENQMMAYLVMMAARLVELHRVLKPTGSLYLHCDPTASHYLKMVLDTIFSTQNFRAEIVWKRSAAHSDAKQGAKQPGRIHDVIFFYSKTNNWIWNTVHTTYDPEYVATNYRHVEEGTGRLFKSTDLTAAKPGGDTSYEWRGRRPAEGRYWAYSKENMQKFESEGRLYYTSSGLPRLKQYLDEMPGVSLQDLWTDIPPISAHAAERLGYPTQKPLALL
jgi:adenine specific DNA methylase Mod